MNDSSYFAGTDPPRRSVEADVHARPPETSEPESFVAQSADALQMACATARLSTRGARLIRIYASAVYHLPEADAVARIARSATPHTVAVAARGLAVTKWLATTHHFPTVTPLIENPLEACGCVVTFWRYLPQEGMPPTAADLGRLLRHLHRLAPPQFPLQTYQPLRSVNHAIELSRAVTESDRRWLLSHCSRLGREFESLRFVLPMGMIHGDAWRGNVLRDGERAVLSDWDAVSRGPREMDLIPTLAAERFGLSIDERNAFIAAYGYDLTAWSGYSTLKAIRELSTLTALLRNAHADPKALQELHRRLQSIQTGDDHQWVTF